jgi:hypothetical protein
LALTHRADEPITSAECGIDDAPYNDVQADITIDRRDSVCTACDSTVDDGISGFISAGSIDRNKTKDYSFLVPLRVVS